jgi:hypothetical protein
MQKKNPRPGFTRFEMYGKVLVSRVTGKVKIHIDDYGVYQDPCK